MNGEETHLVTPANIFLNEKETHYVHQNSNLDHRSAVG